MYNHINIHVYFTLNKHNNNVSNISINICEYKNIFLTFNNIIFVNK